MSFYAIVFSLFFVLNALGNIPLFIGLLARFDAKRQRKIIIREMIIALLILLAFNFFGDDILNLLGVSQAIIGIAGGMLLFIIALGMIFPKDEKTEPPKQEPLIVPLATPIVAGPGAITTVMVYTQQVSTPWKVTGAIAIAWFISLILLLASSNIKYLLGQRGLAACERLGGMIIALLAVQMFTTGITHLIQDTWYAH